MTYGRIWSPTTDLFVLLQLSRFLPFPRYVCLTSTYARPEAIYWVRPYKHGISFIFLHTCYFKFNMLFLRDNLRHCY